MSCIKIYTRLPHKQEGNYYGVCMFATHSTLTEEEIEWFNIDDSVGFISFDVVHEELDCYNLRNRKVMSNPRCYISWIEVKTRWRNMGIGLKLLDNAILYSAKNWNVKHVYLEDISDNVNTCDNIYIKYGFKYSGPLFPMMNLYL